MSLAATGVAVGEHCPAQRQSRSWPHFISASGSESSSTTPTAQR